MTKKNDHKVEVLVATMHQTDFSLIDKMNIQSDAVFANQAQSCGYEEREINGNKVRMVTTNHRGVGRNRNLATLYAQGDILLFSDDDVA